MSNASSFKSSSILFVEEIGPTMCQPVIVVDSNSSHPIKAGRIYLDDKRWITTLRKYLRVFALESGYMFILLFPLSLTNPFNQQSSILSTTGRKFVRNLGSLRAFCLKSPSLPSDLHFRRVRTFITVITAITLSCQRRVLKIMISSDQMTRPCKSIEVHQTFTTPVLQNLKVNTNFIFTVLSLEPIVARPRVASNARRAALGWSKSSIGKPSMTGINLKAAVPFVTSFLQSPIIQTPLLDLMKHCDLNDLDCVVVLLLCTPAQIELFFEYWEPNCDMWHVTVLFIFHLTSITSMIGPYP